MLQKSYQSRVRRKGPSSMLGNQLLSKRVGQLLAFDETIFQKLIFKYQTQEASWPASGLRLNYFLETYLSNIRHKNFCPFFSSYYVTQGGNFFFSGNLFSSPLVTKHNSCSKFTFNFNFIIVFIGNIIGKRSILLKFLGYGKINIFSFFQF